MQRNSARPNVSGKYLRIAKQTVKAYSCRNYLHSSEIVTVRGSVIT